MSGAVPARNGRVAVIGSVNRDVVCEVERLPRPGQTVLARATRENLGGKGSNQAVAAARAGGRVQLVARVGAEEGSALRERFRAQGMDAARVCAVPGARTGTAYITVADGENQIVVDPGANFDWEPDGELAAGPEAEVLAAAEVVVAQLEIPVRVVSWAARHARRLVLNAAPALRLPRELLWRADPLVVNESELAMYARASAATPDEGLRLAQALCRDGVPAVVATLGAAGSVWAARSGSGAIETGYQAAPRVDSVDSTGAGDCYVGALAVALAEGRSMPDAVAFATAAAGLAVRRPGTHASYPDRARITAALADLPAAGRNSLPAH